jgi:hypothetical protein
MFSFTVERQDAEAIRSLLDTFQVIYTVRRRLIFWVRFTVDGMDPDAVRMALDAAHGFKLFGLHPDPGLSDGVPKEHDADASVSL